MNNPKPKRKTGAPPAYFLNALVPGASGLDSIFRSTKNERQPLKSLTTPDIKRQAFLALAELAERVAQRSDLDHGRMSNSAEGLATLAVTAANLLQELANSNSPEERECVALVASQKHFWPVLLHRRARQGKDGKISFKIEGANKANEYLDAIRLGEGCSTPALHLNDPAAGPFKKAAELLLMRLYEFQELGAWRGNPTTWKENLLKLERPMTKHNVDAWWSLAKAWMDEQWKEHPDFFRPLMKTLNLEIDFDKPNFTHSTIRKRVVDDSLKKAFFALAFSEK